MVNSKKGREEACSNRTQEERGKEILNISYIFPENGCGSF